MFCALSISTRSWLAPPSTSLKVSSVVVVVFLRSRKTRPPLVDGAAVIAEHDLRADAAGAGWSDDRDLGGARPREEVGLERVEGPRARWRPEGLRRRRQLSSSGVARRV